MSDILKSQWRKARKRHVCSFCNQYIEPGERYKNELWGYVDPDDSGMTADDFQEAC
jgi:hypothetical protein